MEWCGIQWSLENTHWKETSIFLKLSNDWFDIFNSQIKYGCRPGVNTFGVNLNNQIYIINKMSDVVSRMVVGEHKSLVLFQKGIALSNKSLLEL